MSQADELLESLSVEAQTADEATEEHIVIGADRVIEVPLALRTIAVQHDHNIETVTFDCPRYWDGYDLSMMKIYINYLRPDGVKGSYVAFNIVVDETDDDLIHFNWIISRNVTLVKGNIIFLVCAKEVETDGTEVLHWNSERNEQMYVSEGLETTEEIVEKHPDVITQLLKRMDQMDGGADAIFNIADGRTMGSLQQVNVPDPTGAIKNCVANGEGACAIGCDTQANGSYAYAEGYGTRANSMYSHAEGHATQTNNPGAHAEGVNTQANGTCSHAEGFDTVASSASAHVQGRSNIIDTEGKYAHIVGNGPNVNERSNAHTLDWDGNAWFAGGVKADGNIETKNFKVDEDGNAWVRGEFISGNGKDKLDFPRIGDVKISTRTIDDPQWMHIEEGTYVKESEYPELYGIVTRPEDNIFFNEWYSVTVPDNITLPDNMPICAKDGYIYFTGGGKVVRCKSDFTEFEEYDLPYDGEVIYYPEVEYWVLVPHPKETGETYFSPDCFYTKDNLVTMALAKSTFPVTSDENINTVIFLRLHDLTYHDGKWYACVSYEYKRKGTGDMRFWSCNICSAESLSDGFVYVDKSEFNFSVGTGAINSIRFTDNGGAYISSCNASRWGEYHYPYPDHVGIYYNPDISSYQWTKISSAQIYHMIYYPEINHLFCSNIGGSVYYIYSDGENIRYFSGSHPCIYKSHYYYSIKDGTRYRIRRELISNLDGSNYEECPAYELNGLVDMVSGDDCVIAVISNRVMYYLNDLGQTKIQEALPGTIFKTYIKCK